MTMMTYQYEAKNAAGGCVAGSVRAESAAAAARMLDERKLFPVDIRPAAPSNGIVRRGQRVKNTDLGLFYSQLGDLLRTGVPLLRALETLLRGCAGSPLGAMLRRVREDVAAGKTLAHSMANQSEAVAPLHVTMIRAGERGAFLEDVLANLATFIERHDELQTRVRGAMIYPVLLTTIGTGLLTVALLVLVPKFKPMFDGVALPAPTRALFLVSDLVTGFWPITLVMMVVAVPVLWSWSRSRGGRRMLDRALMKTPIIGRAVRMVRVTRFCRVLGTLLANGVPLLEAMEISRAATGSDLFATTIEKAAERVRSGQALAAPLRQSGLFPVQVVEMIAVAEETNQLDRVLMRIAETVERRANREVDHVVRLIEPAILIVVAAVIGLVAVGLLYPIFTMARTLG